VRGKLEAGYACTYFFPMQFLGPIEKGCITFLLSEAYGNDVESESQRSGIKESGSRK
jgi:hypothetical protein